MGKHNFIIFVSNPTHLCCLFHVPSDDPIWNARLPGGGGQKQLLIAVVAVKVCIRSLHSPLSVDGNVVKEQLNEFFIL